MTVAPSIPVRSGLSYRPQILKLPAGLFNRARHLHVQSLPPQRTREPNCGSRIYAVLQWWHCIPRTTMRLGEISRNEMNKMLFVDYIEKLQRLLDRIRGEQATAIVEAGHLVAEALARGGLIHTFGTGHSHMIAEEAFYRAGGLVPVSPILDERLAFLKGAAESTCAERELGYARNLLSRHQVGPADVSILISNSGRNAAPVEMAMEMNSRGVGVIAITNLKQSSRSPSRHVSGKRLFELANVVVDTCIPEGDASMILPGMSVPIGPCSTVVGAAIMNSIVIEAVAELLQNGKTAPIFPSANLTSSTDETLSALVRLYSGRIRYLQGV